MSDSTQTPTTVSNIGVVMFTVADQDEALAFYTSKLGFEVRGDTRFGEHDESRWLEVAPPGSRTTIALLPAGVPTGIRLATEDATADHTALRSAGADVDPEVMRLPDAPPMFSLRDPDGNTLILVEWS